ncbi:MAG: PKD domain-containing protein [Acidobacteriota bacterium]
MTRRLLAVALAVALSACSLDKQTVPALVGPSELGLSITMLATPDILTQDGKSQSEIQITALDYLSQPVRGLVLRVQTTVGGNAVDFGTLSAKTVSTNNDGKASVTYSSPAAPPPTVTDDQTVAVEAVPVSANYGNAISREVRIHLLRPGVVLPANGAPTPDFFFSPTAPREHDDVQFDGAASTDADGTIASYSWSFGDGDSGTGARASHAYAVAGTYNVVLTVTDNRGLSASSAPKTVQVGTAALPTADFAFSPTTPGANVPVNFNAAASTAITGRRIVDYDFDFGDGSGHSHGITAQHAYTLPGSYAVVLSVTDDSGRMGTVSKTVTVTALGPAANFTFSPTSPTPTRVILFDASSSTTSAGRTITSYSWNFGDPGAVNNNLGGKTVTFNGYALPGTYTVTLTIIDNLGAQSVTSKTVTVTP